MKDGRIGRGGDDDKSGRTRKEEIKKRAQAHGSGAGRGGVACFCSLALPPSVCYAATFIISRSATGSPCVTTLRGAVKGGGER